MLFKLHGARDQIPVSTFAITAVGS